MRVFSRTVSTCLRSFRFRAADEHGATMLEMAMVAPIFFLLLFGFIDIARYWQAKAAVSTAAQEAVSRLAVDPRLKNSESHSSVLAEEQGGPLRESRVKKRVTDLVLQRDPSPVVNVVIPDVQRFESEPLEVTVTISFDPLLPIVWSSRIPVTTRASGYVEPLKTTSEPIPTDCNGNFYDLMNPPGASPYNLECPCTKGNLSYFNGQGICVCSGEDTVRAVNGGTTTISAECGCPEGKKPILGFDWRYTEEASGWTEEKIKAKNASSTICCDNVPEIQQQCPGNLTRTVNIASGQYSCQCSCGSEATQDATSGNCVCTNPHETYSVNSNFGTPECSCHIQSSDCPAPSRVDSENCECVCDDPQIFDSDSKSCVCREASKTTCEASGGTFDSTTCKCGCSGERVLSASGDKCECKAEILDLCSASGGTPNPDTCGCECSTLMGEAQNGACTCPGGYDQTDWWESECYCPGYSYWDSDTRSCGCPSNISGDCASGGGNFSQNDCSCYCTGNNRYFDPQTKRCGCYSPYRTYCENYSQYGFAPGTWDDTSCSCSCPARSRSYSSIYCLCTGGTSLVNGSCECPAKKVWNAQTNLCQCDVNNPDVKKCLDSGGRLNAACTCVSCVSPDRTVVAGKCECTKSGQISDGGTGCTCDTNSSTALSCTSTPSGGTLNAQCGCDCKNGKTVVGGNACGCDLARGLELTADNSGCQCDISSGLAGACKATGGKPDPLNCDCSCTGNLVPATQNQCACSSNLSTPCTSSGGSFNSSPVGLGACSCNCGDAEATGDSCRCSNGATLVNGKCNCPTLQTDASGTCACDDSLPAVRLCRETGQINETTCACTCLNVGETFSPTNGCKCPVGQSPQSGRCQCDVKGTPAEAECVAKGGYISEVDCACRCYGDVSNMGPSGCQCNQEMATYQSGVGCSCPTSWRGYNVTGGTNRTCVASCSRFRREVVPGYCSPTTCDSSCNVWNDDGGCDDCPGENT